MACEGGFRRFRLSHLKVSINYSLERFIPSFKLVKIVSQPLPSNARSNLCLDLMPTVVLRASRPTSSLSNLLSRPDFLPYFTWSEYALGYSASPLSKDALSTSHHCYEA